MTLADATEGREYIVEDVVTQDEELKAFLFSLGCYAGEPVTVVLRRKKNLVISIKEGRYTIDNQLANLIQRSTFPVIRQDFEKK